MSWNLLALPGTRLMLLTKTIIAIECMVQQQASARGVVQDYVQANENTSQPTILRRSTSPTVYSSPFDVLRYQSTSLLNSLPSFFKKYVVWDCLLLCCLSTDCACPGKGFDPCISETRRNIKTTPLLGSVRLSSSAHATMIFGLIHHLEWNCTVACHHRVLTDSITIAELACRVH